MAKITSKSLINVEFTFTLSESETRALDALTGYGDDPFIAKFYESLGKHYMEPHEKGLREFLRTIREIVPGHLSRVDAARKAFEGK